MNKRNFKGWLYLLPAMLFLGIFMVYPLIDVFIYSFEEGYNSASQTYYGTGMYNYSYVLHDPYFLQAIRNTFILVAMSVLQFIYDNIMYAELNTKSDYCQCCGYDGEIKIVEDDGKLVWECPKCGNRDQNKLNVARRTCGYIGTQFWNQGRTQEIKDRVLHL